MLYLLIVMAISALVIVHEFGHYLVARAFGMRVVTYSIGFGPVLARWRPRGSETVFQIAAIPMLAYVQIAGMNPREPVDPNDRGSYQNASPLGRFFTIAAGPLANYLAAAAIVFGLLFGGGRAVRELYVFQVVPGAAAATAGFHVGDGIVRVDAQPMAESMDFIRHTEASRGQPMTVLVRRDGREFPLTVAPRFDAAGNHYRIGVELGYRDQAGRYIPVGVGEAAANAMIDPALFTVANVQMLVRTIRGRERLQVMGPVGIVHETARETRLGGWRRMLETLVMISIALFIFNLVPIPALDGGRLVFLLYEMVRRRRPSPTLELRATAISMMILLALSAVVFVRDIKQIHDAPSPTAVRR